MYLKMKEELISRKSECVEKKRSGRGNEGWSCEKDLRSVGRGFQRRVEELREERSENLSLQGRGGIERQKW